jgi:prepilin peptidase CpaA
MVSLLLLQSLCLLVLMGLLVRMAVGDLRAFIIPNRLNAGIAALGLAYVLLSAPADGIFATLLWRLIQMFAVGLMFSLMFAMGWMGGGDVKLMAALALFFPMPELAQLLIFSSLAGGGLGLLAAIAKRWKPAMVDDASTSGPTEIPYGIAIAFGAIIPASQLFVKTAVTLLQPVV